MRQHAGDRFDNEENRVDHQNDDENFSMLTSQGGYFFCFLLATSVHKVNLSNSTLTVPRAGRALSRPVHHDSDPNQTYRAANQVERVWFVAIHEPTPEKRDNKEAAVSGIDATEVGWLKGWDNTVEKEDQTSQQSPRPRPTFPKPLPYKPPAPNLT